jgi:2-dehydro-3-deoxyglucarate aldolase/4-hydroxy-2-oxoheptanedioate aldolase
MSYLNSANAEIIVMIAVETTEAVNNLDEILGVTGLDGIFIGPMDLASSMGHLGNPAHPEAQEQIAIIEKKVLASDKFLGTVATTADKAKACFDKGYQWLIVMQDGAALHKAGDDVVAAFRNSYVEVL